RGEGAPRAAEPNAAGRGGAGIHRLPPPNAREVLKVRLCARALGPQVCAHVVPSPRPEREKRPEGQDLRDGTAVEDDADPEEREPREDEQGPQPPPRGALPV